jgi:hypothetical protein
MGSLDLAAGFIVQLLFLQRLDLRLGQEDATPCVQRRPEPHTRAQCTDGDLKDLVVSPCGLGKDPLIKFQIRHCPPQKRVLSLKQLQSFQLATAHDAILFTPAIICLKCITNLMNRIRLRLTLAL